MRPRLRAMSCASATIWAACFANSASAGIGFLSWQYEKLKKPIPTEDVLEQQAVKIVAEAHDIARKRGHNVMSIIKDLIAEIKK